MLLTSFSPQMWLMVDPEAGLEAGPITETTPFGRIWHTEREKTRVKVKLCLQRCQMFAARLQRLSLPVLCWRRYESWKSPISDHLFTYSFSLDCSWRSLLCRDHFLAALVFCFHLIENVKKKHSLKFRLFYFLKLIKMKLKNEWINKEWKSVELPNL